MIILYTDKSKIPDGYKLIIANDSYFDAYVADNITSEDLKVMQEIDRVLKYYEESDKIETPYGITNIFDLSTGCKTYINLLHLTESDKTVISLNECGANVLNIILDTINSKRSYQPVYLSIPTEVIKCNKELRFNLNNSNVIVDKFKLAGEIV